MRIQYTNDEKMVNFGSILVGGVFKYEGKYYMRIRTIRDIDDTMNAVELSGGNTYYFLDNDPVCLIISELLIYEYGKI